ncbi:MAG: thiosulfate oxidation carrier protein SoxY [Aquimonas sp.]|mgnify:CR=1 FL=1|jgi:sulfur-oxidizing protein SoxY|nr:thiosulfate oxidation carrier protein SoxY [Aquimonas sp.]
MSLDRRNFLSLGVAALGTLVSGLSFPLRLLAQHVRPDAAFAATDMAGVYAAIGSTPETSAEIVFTSPEIAENGAVVPVSVTSNIPGTTKISILVEKNPNPLTAVFYIAEGTQASVQTRVKVAQTCNLYAVIEANGKLFSASRETKVTLGGCGG